MGYVAHDAVIAVISDYDKDTIAAIEAFREKLREARSDDPFESDFARFLVGPVVGSNGYHMYAFLPDGSKEGWGISDTVESWRDQFRDIAKGTRYEDGSGSGDVVHVRFGGDFGGEIGTRIVSTTDPFIASLQLAAERIDEVMG